MIVHMHNARSVSFYQASLRINTTTSTTWLLSCRRMCGSTFTTGKPFQHVLFKWRCVLFSEAMLPFKQHKQFAGTRVVTTASRSLQIKSCNFMRLILIMEDYWETFFFVLFMNFFSKSGEG